jgi:hypothetical protein
LAADLVELVDITARFDADENFLTVGNVSYRCCCELDSNKTGVKCELVDVLKKPARNYKKGCGALMGDGFHAWYNMKTQSKYKDLTNAGNCVVPSKEAAEKLGAKPRDPEELVDVTEHGVTDEQSFVLSNMTYSCCCQHNSNQTDVTCELLDVTNSSVKKCGALKGAGFHAWYNMKSNRKYKQLPHAGKCVVPWKLLEAIVA